MSAPEWIVITVIVGAMILIITDKLRADVVALLALLALAVTGVITPADSVAGFSSGVTITLIGLFIISEALDVTGVVQAMGALLYRLGGGGETRLVLVIMGGAAALSLMMNNIAAAAVILPAALYVAREAGVKPSKLLIPLAFGTLVGGMATYFTTANIVLSDHLLRQGLDGLSMGDFIPTGGVIAVVGIVFMAVIGRRLLPDRASLSEQANPVGISRQLFDAYQLSERLWELRVPAGTPLVDVALRASGIGSDLGLTVLAIWRGHQAILTPGPDETLHADDLLLVLGREDRVEGLLALGLEFGRANEIDEAQLPRRAQAVALTEVVIPPRSAVIGRTLAELRFRSKYGLTSVALWRGGRSYRTDVGKFPLQVGDALLMVGPAAQIAALSADRDYMVTSSSHAFQPPNPQKAWRAIVITSAVFLAAIFEIVPTAEAMLIGGVAMVLARCLTMDDAYRAIDWRTIFQIAGMSAVSLAMIQTGLAERIGGQVVGVLAPFGPLALIGGLFIVIMLLAQIIGGQSTALIAAPIAVAAALQVGISPQAMAVAMAIACSTAFLTLTAHPVNVLVVGPGGYRPSDFLKVGLVMTVITIFLTVIGMRVFWGIGA